MQRDVVATPTPLANRAYPRFAYRHTPTAELPLPVLPERIVLPGAAIHDAFVIEIACDDRTEHEAYALRWEVYCHELGYEEGSPEHKEYDAADQRSVQVVVRHRATGRVAACYRLVMADPDHPDIPFHVEEVCGSIDRLAVPARGEARRGFAELSRFCIAAAYRSHDLVAGPPPGISAPLWSAEAAHRRGLAGLMWLSAAHIAVSIRLDYLLTLMEPRLRQLGTVMGLGFAAIGGPVEFRGVRVPYRIDRRSLRSLLEARQTAALVGPLRIALDGGIRRHPLLAAYLDNRSGRSLR